MTPQRLSEEQLDELLSCVTPYAPPRVWFIFVRDKPSPIGKQVLRSGTSVGAHYREAFRARSDAEFISKLEGGLQELDESAYWMELLCEAGIVPQERLSDLMDEASQLSAILVSCVTKVKSRPKGRATP